MKLTNKYGYLMVIEWLLMVIIVMVIISSLNK